MKIKVNNRKNLNYLLVFLLGLIIAIPIFNSDIDIYANSGFNEIAEGYEFSKNFNINEGKILSSFYNHLGGGNALLKSPLSMMILFLRKLFI